MMKSIPVLFLLIFTIPAHSQTQYQYWQWAKSFGGNGTDKVVDIKIRNGFIYVTGTFTSSAINWDGTILQNHGAQDIFIAKMDTLGNTIWVKNFGSTHNDNVHQLELNNSNAMVIRCTSKGSTITAGNYHLNNPANFYCTLDDEGNVLNAVALVPSVVYPDIDIDNGQNIYLAATYTFPFVFAGTYIDSAFGLAGAAALKYDRLGNEIWYKNLQVRSNDYLPYFIGDYFDANNPPVWRYPPAETGDAYAAMKIEYNEDDTTLGVICSYFRHAQIGNDMNWYNHLFADYPNEKPKAMHMKIAADGGARLTSFCTQWYTYSGGWVGDFKTAKDGHSYTTWGYYSLGGTLAFNFSKEKNGVLETEKYYGYNNNGFTITAPTFFSPTEISETGNYLLCRDVPEYAWPTDTVNRNLVILDTSLNEVKETNILELTYINPLHKCMRDTNAIYIGSSYDDSSLVLNQQYPAASITLHGNGMQQIFIGKYSFGVCNSMTVTKNTRICKGNSYTFPDSITWHNITADTNYTCTIPSVFGCDSVITTHISVINTDTSITKTNLVLSANETPALYQWINCSNGSAIPGAVNQTYTASSIGSYAVAINKEGCADTSSCYTITAAQILSGGRQLVNVYPVPSQNYYTLSVQSERPAKLEIVLLDFTGNKVQQQTVRISFGENIIRQNISTLMLGIYTLQLKNTMSGETVVKTIIKM